MDKKLINFRTPIDLQNTFDLVCCYKSQTRTQVLIELMRQYVENHHQPIISQMDALKVLNKQLSEIVGSNSNKRSYEPIKDPKCEGDLWDVDETEYFYPFHRGDIK